MSTNVAKSEDGAVVRGQGSHEVTVFFLESSKRVLWIEADKKFVDILLNFLLLPVGAAVQAVSRQVEGRNPDPIGGLGNIFCNIESPGMQGKVPTLEVVAKLLNPPPVLSNSKRLENAYACATMSMRKECGQYDTEAWCWEALWDDRNPFQSCQNPQTAMYDPCLKGLPVKLYEMAKWHTYIVTENLEVHPSSVAKGMDLLRGVQYGQVVKTKRVVGSNEVLALLRASLTKTSPLNEVIRWNDSS